MKRFGLLIALHGLVLAAPQAASALDVSMQPFTVRRWTELERLFDVAPGPDGMLWLASRAGLIRFDGERFLDVPLGADGLRAGTWVRRVLAARDGAVWAATGAGELSFAAGGGLVPRHDEPAGGLTRLDPALPAGESGRIRRFSAQDGLPDGWAWALLDDPAGGLWVGTEAGLARFQDGRFHRFTAADGVPPGPVTALALRAGGLLVAATDRGVMEVRGGRFVPTAI